MRLGMFTVVRRCSPQAHFLDLLFAVCRQILLGVAVQIAVLL